MSATNNTRPTVVCLCGSNRFWRDYIEQNIILTLAGCIVITVGGFITDDVAVPPYMRVEASREQKQKLDDLHLRKIDIADEVLILNRGTYIGESTRAELKYAREQRKLVRFLEPPKPEDWEIPR
jgi:cell division protein FtsB